MNLQTIESRVSPSFAAMSPRSPLSADSVVLRHLRSRSEIEGVMHLRGEIDLSVHNSAGSGFLSLEKKETNSGLSSLLTSTGTS
jgi:hypothetical protein